MFCPNCGKQNEDEARNCSQCGTLLADEQVMEQAAEVVNPEVAETNAETVAEQAVATETTEETTYFEEEYIPQQTNGNIKKIIIGAVALVAIAIVAFFAVKFIGNIGGSEVGYGKYPVIYEKDGEVMVRPHGKKESYEIADSDGSYYSFKIEITNDGSRMFFADSDDDEFDLYFRKIKDMNPDDGKGTKIAKDVTSFKVLPEGNAVVYLRDEKLCYSNLKEERVLDKDVSDFSVSFDGKKVIYKDNDDKVYICGFGKNDSPEKVDSDVEEIVSAYGEYEEMYYIKDGKLYRKLYGKEKEKILGDVLTGTTIGDNIYVMKKDTKELKFKDLFTDDVTDSAELIDPDDLVEPDYDDYDDYDDYSDAWDAYWDEYEAASELWDSYETKEEIEEYFDENPFEMPSYTLYSIKGTKYTKLDEGLTSTELYQSNGYGFYAKAEQGEIEKLKLSKVSSQYDALNQLEEMASGDSNNGFIYVITPENKVFEGFEADDKYVSDFEVSENGKYLYCLQADEKYGAGDVVRYNIGSSALSKEKTIIENTDYYTYYNDDLIVASNEDDEFVGFINGKETEISDESVSSPKYINGTLYFLDDYSNNSGELVSYKNGKKKTIINDVYAYAIYDESKIAYIKDYDDDDNCGDLYIGNKNGKSTLVDDEVSKIIFAY